MRKLLLTAGVAMLAIAGTAHAATPRGRRPGLNCKNVQTMTMQWLCDMRITKTAPTVPALMATAPAVVRAGIGPPHTPNPENAEPVTVIRTVTTTYPPMWRVFTPGTSWLMRSSVDGHKTWFHIRRMTHWGCWTGDLIDLVDVKPAAEDYWAPGLGWVGHQILYHDPSGSWRMVGTYTRARDGAPGWTMQIHGYPGQPTPYVIVPGRQANSDTRTTYYTNYVSGAVVSSCIPGASAAPEWAQHVYWRSQFHFTSSNTLQAHYEENRCGALPCQVEDWTFASDNAGIARIADLRSGGNPLDLTLARISRRQASRASRYR